MIRCPLTKKGSIRLSLLLFARLCGCGGKVLVPGRITVGFDPDVTQDAAERIVENNGLSPIEEDICVKSRGFNPMERRVFVDAAVPFGEEALWQARLKRIPGVLSTAPCYERPPK